MNHWFGLALCCSFLCIPIQQVQGLGEEKVNDNSLIQKITVKGDIEEGVYLFYVKHASGSKEVPVPCAKGCEIPVKPGDAVDVFRLRQRDPFRKVFFAQGDDNFVLPFEGVAGMEIGDETIDFHISVIGMKPKSPVFSPGIDGQDLVISWTDSLESIADGYRLYVGGVLVKSVESGHGPYEFVIPRERQISVFLRAFKRDGDGEWVSPKSDEVIEGFRLLPEFQNESELQVR